MMSLRKIIVLSLLTLGICLQGMAQVPPMINYQGRIVVGGTNFNGTGQFKFALVNGTGSQTYWSNGASAVSLPVNKGLYALLLGDTNLSNMASGIPATVFTNSDVRLRVWFNDGVSGLQQLSPDQRLGAVGYALMANVADGSITSNKLATGAVGSTQLSSNLTVAGTLTAAAFSGNAAGLTNLNAPNLTGTVADARLSTNVALRNASQTFTGTNTFTAGNVGIGTTTPRAGLEIERGAVNLPALRLTSASSGHGSGAWLENYSGGVTNTWSIYAGSDTALHFGNQQRGKDAMTITTNLNVGIGTTAPGRPLQVGDANVSGSEGMIRLGSRSPSTAERRTWDIGTPQTGSDVSGIGYSFIIDDVVLGSDPEFIIKYGSGRVGIGETNPVSLLDVNGTVTAYAFSGNGAGLTNVTPSDGSVTEAKLAAGAVTSASLSSNLTVAGTVSAASFQGSGVLPWQAVGGTTLYAVANTAYLLTNAAQATVTLPVTANLGDLVQVSGVGTGGWQVAGSIVGETPGVLWTARADNQNWLCVASSADGTKLVSGSEIGWNAQSWPVANINASGLASTLAVYADTSATVTGTYYGVPGEANLLVLDSDPDNYGIYALDQVPDWWQVQFFGTSNTAGRAGATNATGQNNLYAYIADLCPTNPNSSFEIVSVTNRPLANTVYFMSSSNRLYLLAWTTNLITGTWTNLAGAIPVAGNGGLFSLNDTNTAAPRYYHVSVRIP